MLKSTLLHLRFPFSFFLLPVFLFALTTCQSPRVFNIIIVFIILHILVYPASNGFNSYFDRDEGSIGGLKYPPKVSKQLYYAALFLDFLALVLAVLISWLFMAMVLIYGLVSKAYSHPLIRLKKYPFIGWMASGLFQGAFTFVMSRVGMLELDATGLKDQLIPAMLATVLILGSYPMTQVYQHEEDAVRGDNTLSLQLGVTGTFLFSGGIFMVAMFGFSIYFFKIYSMAVLWLFMGLQLPIVIYFLYWFLMVLKDKSKADYNHTMKLNLITSFMLNGFFIFLTLTQNASP